MWDQGRDALRDGRWMEAEYALRTLLQQQQPHKLDGDAGSGYRASPAGPERGSTTSRRQCRRPRAPQRETCKAFMAQKPGTRRIFADPAESRIGIVGWIFLKVRLGTTGPFLLGLTAGALWLAILAPYALADSDSGLRLFTGFIALFTALCALRILAALGLRLRARLSGTGPRLSSHLW